MKKALAIMLTGLCLCSAAQAQTKTVTNADLDKYRRERLKSDPDDERERARLGLPSRAEEKRARERRAAEIAEIAERIREQQAETENYWLEQAFELRSEIAAVEAEMNYVRVRIGEIPPPQVYYAIGYNAYYFTPNYSRIIGGRKIEAGIRFNKPSDISPARNYSRNIFKGNRKTSIGQISAPLGNSINRAPNRRFGYGGTFVVPFALPTYENLTREDSLTRLHLLEQTRAGLYARFAVLEDEAHKAGVKID